MLFVKKLEFNTFVLTCFHTLVIVIESVVTCNICMKFICMKKERFQIET